MENSDNNAWTGNNIFAHLNDFEESVAESILEANKTGTVADLHDDRDKSAKDTANNSGTGHAKIGIKIPKLEGTNKSYVLQCQVCCASVNHTFTTMLYCVSMNHIFCRRK